MKTRSQLFIPILLFFFLLCSKISYGQSDGLGFYSHEVVQDQRTGLDLSPGKTLCFNNSFEISFDLSFFPSRIDYFGYIVRFIGIDNSNIDLIYDKESKESNHFKIIIGEKFSKIAFDIPSKTLFSKWNTIKLRFDYEKKILRLSNGRSSYEAYLPLKKNDCFKVLFGANEYLRFKTTDVPPMKIRNIGITRQGKKKYYWPLNEYDGFSVTEDISGENARAVRPMWVKKMHSEWQLLLSTTINGPASVAFDAKKEILHVVGNDTLLNYAVKEGTTSKTDYTQGRLNLLRGGQSVMNANGDLINFYIDTKTVSTFNQENKSWTENFDPNTNITDFWLYNKFYTPLDSSLYIIAGYGHFKYKNQIQQYHFPSKSWKNVKVSGDPFIPRYLAALGYSNNGAYLLGGYGSTTGQQMLNPRNLYDLLYFDIKSKTIKKIYELKIKGEDFVFANSLIIDEKKNSYYALKFPKHKYKSNLQLIEGSLTKPEFKISANPIPYLFHDIRSFADLFYCPESKRFIAVTLYWEDNNQTKVKVYSLYAPPNDKYIQTGYQNSSFLWYMGIGILLTTVIAGMIFYSRKKMAKPDLTAIPNGTKKPNTMYKKSIFLFGDMQVFDKEGNEITRQFTPVIRELFLVILIYTIRWERGISSEKLKELLWFDKSEESARNNRAVSIVKLKGILDKINNGTISKDTGYWKLDIDFENTYVDYWQYMAIIKNKKTLNKQSISELAEIIKRGPFLSNVNYEWIDAFKAEVSNEIIDTYLHFAHSIPINDDPELLVEIANYIFYFDSVNEEAMIIKCKALVHLGKHSQSKKTYEDFCEEYKILYNADFDKSFNTVLNSDPIAP